jgi:hypothetical protein
LERRVGSYDIFRLNLEMYLSVICTWLTCDKCVIEDWNTQYAWKSFLISVRFCHENSMNFCNVTVLQLWEWSYLSLLLEHCVLQHWMPAAPLAERAQARLSSEALRGGNTLNVGATCTKVGANQWTQY